MVSFQQRTVFEEFNPTDGDIESYLDRLSQYFIAVDILDNDANKAKRKAILLSSIGGATYKTLKDLSFPQQPHEKAFEDLCKLLKGQYKPKRLMVAERFRFHNAKQAPGQSICDFAAHLKKLAVYCEFMGNQLQDSLRDRLICGLLSESIQKKLLARNYTFQQALEVALAEEAAARNVRDMTTDESKEVNRMVSSRKMQKSRKPSNTTRRCDRCGLTNHSRDECRYKNATCYKCNQNAGLIVNQARLFQLHVLRAHHSTTQGLKHAFAMWTRMNTRKRLTI